MLKIMLVIFALCTISFVNCDPIKRVVAHFPKEVGVEIHKGVAACTVPGLDVAKTIKIIHTSQYVEEDSFKKFIECIAKTLGYAGPDGRFIVDKVIALYPDQKRMAEIVTECNKKPLDDTPDEVTYQMYKCVQMQSPYDVHF